MDGHGTSGHHVSTYLAQHLPAVLLQKLMAAAAAGSSSEPPAKQRRLFGKAAKQQQQQQDLEFGIAQVPYVVVPDHWPKYGFTPGQVYGSSSSSSSSTPPLEHPPGRAVIKQQLVQQKLHSHPLDNDSSSSSGGYSHSSSQMWLSPVSAASVVGVPLSQELLAGAFTATDALLAGSGVNVVDRWERGVAVGLGLIPGRGG
jgi:hypothetical protein